MLFDLLISAKTTLMPYVYNQAVRVAIGVDIGVVSPTVSGVLYIRSEILLIHRIRR